MKKIMAKSSVEKSTVVTKSTQPINNVAINQIATPSMDYTTLNTDDPITTEEIAILNLIGRKDTQIAVETAIREMLNSGSFATNKSINDLLNAVDKLGITVKEAITQQAIDNRKTYAELIDRIVLPVVNDLTSYQKKTNESIEQLRQLVFTTSNSIKRLPSNVPDELKCSISRREVAEWRTNVFDKGSEMIGKRSKKRSQYDRDVEIYEQMKANGINLERFHEIYSNIYAGNKKDMIAHSDFLRRQAEIAIEQLHMRYYPDHFTTVKIAPKNTPLSTKFITTPKEVTECYDIYANKLNISRQKAIRRILSIMANDYSIDLKGGAAKYAAKFGYKNCCNGYYIAQNDKLFKLFKQIVEEA